MAIGLEESFPYYFYLLVCLCACWDHHIYLPTVYCLDCLCYSQYHVYHWHIDLSMHIKPISLKFRIRPHIYFYYQIPTIIAFPFKFYIRIVLYAPWDVDCLICFGLLSSSALTCRAMLFYFFAFSVATLTYTLHNHHPLFYTFKSCPIAGITVDSLGPWFGP